MATFDEMSKVKTMARVRAVAHNGHRIYLEFRNGNIVIIDNDEAYEFDVGSVLLIGEENQIDLAPNDIWPEEIWVGIVRIKHDEKTIVSHDGRLKILPTRNDLSYREGNTVEAKDSLGVVSVLSESPIKTLDLPAIDDAVINEFRIEKEDNPETFADFGGLQNVVDRARELIELPLTRKRYLDKIGARPIKGVLFTGLPGTGKTMLARIIANNTDAAFYKISGPEIISKWYGQSEEILRKLFEDAAKQTQAIIFFDEIDSVASKRADESHEGSRRVVAQLLSLMDGFSSNKNVIVIAATNRPQDIDAALRRPGRFDWEVNFPLPTRDDREAILRVSTNKLSTSEDLPHSWVAEHTGNWTAAELAAIWSEAALLAAADERSSIMTEDYIGGFERVSTQRGRVGQKSFSGDSL